MCPSARTIGVGLADHHTMAFTTRSPTPSGPTTNTTSWDDSGPAAPQQSASADRTPASRQEKLIRMRSTRELSKNSVAWFASNGTELGQGRAAVAQAGEPF